MQWRRRIVLLLTILQPILPQSAEELSAKADAARAANRLDEAVKLYHEALAMRPKWAEGWWSLGTIEYDQNLYKDAAEAFRRLTELDSKAGTARIMLGLCEFELGQEESALKHIQEGEQIGVVEDKQLRNVALYHEGVLLQRAGKFEGAQQALESLCLGGVETPELDAALGMAVLRIRAKQPSTAEIANVGHAQCLAAQKKFDEARALYAQSVAAHSDFPNIHYAYGRFLLDARDMKAGIAELQQEIKQQPNDAIARLQIAAAEYKVDSAAGLPYAEEAVKVAPELPLAHYLLGLLLLDTNNYKRAIPELETAERGLPKEAGVYSALGTAYALAGRDADAGQAREQAAKLRQQVKGKMAADEHR